MLGKVPKRKCHDAARRREIDVADPWLLATLQELDHLGVGFVSLTEALDLTTPAGRGHGCITGRICRVREGDSAGTSARRSGPCPAERQEAGSASNGSTAS